LLYCFPSLLRKLVIAAHRWDQPKVKESKTTHIDRTQVIVIYNNVHGEHLPHYNNYDSNIFSKISPLKTLTGLQEDIWRSCTIVKYVRDTLLWKVLVL
jgi:hypothetical protein